MPKSIDILRDGYIPKHIKNKKDSRCLDIDEAIRRLKRKMKMCNACGKYCSNKTIVCECGESSWYGGGQLDMDDCPGFRD